MLIIHLNSFLQKLVLNIFVLLLLVGLLFLSVKNVGDLIQINIEAEDADEIIYPIAIEDFQEASGGKAIVSKLGNHQQEAYALYHFSCPVSAVYYFWGRCYWPGMCSNNFRVSIDGQDKYLFGGGPKLKEFHWVEGPAFQLDQGEHFITIWSDEFDATLDKFILSTDPYTDPTANTDEMVLLIDFENGIDNNFEYNRRLWSLDEEKKINAEECLLSESDLYNAVAFLSRFKFPGLEEFSELLSLTTKQKIDEYNYKTPPSKELLASIISDLNEQLKGNLIYDHDYFPRGLKLPERYHRMIKENKGQNSVIINRLLMTKLFGEEIRPLEQENSSLYVNAASGTEEGFISKFSGEENFIFQCSLKFERNDQINKAAYMYFDYKSKDNTYRLRLENNVIVLEKIQQGNKVILERADAQYAGDMSLFNRVTICKINDSIDILFNGKQIIRFRDKKFGNGKIGIGSVTGGVYWDNLIYTTNYKENQFDNFFNLHRNWYAASNSKIVNGFWYSDPNGVMSMRGQQIDYSPAIMVFGEEYWSNYSLQAAIKPVGEKWVGLCMNYQNEENYYLFRWTCNQQNRAEEKVQFVKLENGQITVIDEAEGGYEKGNWYSLEMKNLDGQIACYIDHEHIFTIEDSTFQYGKAGFWTDSNHQEYFDCFKVKPTLSMNLNPPGRLTYNFEIREQAALDLCDWYFESGLMLSVPDNSPWTHEQWQKPANKTIKMTHKRNLANDFKLEVHFLERPSQDNNLTVSLFCQNQSEKVQYDFVMRSSGCTLFENEHNIRSLKGFYSTNQFTVERDGDRWRLHTAGKVLEYRDGKYWENITLSIGISGPKAEEIQINSITIQGIHMVTQLDKSSSLDEINRSSQ